MYICQPIVRTTLQCWKRSGLTVIMLVLLLTVCFRGQAQFVDISIDLPASIGLKSIGLRPAPQNLDGTRVGNLTSQQEKMLLLNWIRLRLDENMVLMVEVVYRDLAADKIDLFVAYLNNGSDRTLDARLLKQNCFSFPANYNTWQRTRMNSPPQQIEAWIGIPAGTVLELTIEYN